MAFEIRKLAPEDDRARFRSGNADLNRFFARYTGQNPLPMFLELGQLAKP